MPFTRANLLLSFPYPAIRFLPRDFGAVERLVGLPYQGQGGFGIDIQRRHPSADGQRSERLFLTHWGSGSARSSHPGALGDGQGSLFARFGENDRELLTTVAGHDIHVA